MANSPSQFPRTPWQQHLHRIIFEAETPGGKLFDVVLLCCIVLSVLVVTLESVTDFRLRYGTALLVSEWMFTFLFTIEYLLRLISVRRPAAYARSFFGLVDLCSILPTYASLLIPGTQYLLVIRILRLLRIFRILKLAEYLHESGILSQALWASRRKISVFLLTVVNVVVIVGTLMYVIEGEANGFTDIPTSIYWAVVTLTTVGYGDVAPQTPFGQAVASLVMLLGYGIIAVPTGIVTLELSRAASPSVSTRSCPHCGRDGHDRDALCCKYCGGTL